MNKTLKMIKCLVLMLVMQSCLVFFMGLPIYAIEKTINIMIIHSYDLSYSWTDGQDEGIRNTILEAYPKANIYTENLDSKRISEDYIMSIQKDNFVDKYSNLQMDLILTTDDLGLEFAIKVRDELQRDIPIAFCGVQEIAVDKIVGDAKNITGVYEIRSFTRMIELMRILQPEAEKVVIINDRSSSSKQMVEKILIGFDTLKVRDNYILEFWEDKAYADILQDVSTLEKDTAVYLISYFESADGVIKDGKVFSQEISKVSSVPMYSLGEIYFGEGLVGGDFLSPQLQGKELGGIAIDILEGIPAKDIPYSSKSTSYLGVDENMTRKYKLEKIVLPEDTVVINKKYNFYESYTLLIWLVLLGFVVLIGFIGILLNQKRMINLANKNLIESEQKYVSYIENAPDGIFVTDETGHYLEVNEAASLITGYGKNELLDMRISDILVPEALEDGINHFKRLVKTGKSSGVMQYKHKDGSNRWWSVDAVKLTNHRFLGFAKDISERKHMEAELHHNMNDLLKSQKIAQLGTWRLDLATNHVVWSEELYKMYGYDPTIPPPPYTEHMKLFTPESWDELSTSLERTSTTGIPYELELETVNKDGSNGWMWVRGEAEKDSNGNIIFLHGAAQDITTRKKMELQLRESEERFQLLFNKAPLGYQSLDSEGHFIEVNQKWLDILGYDREEVIGKWFGDFLCSEYVEEFRQRFPLFKAQGHIHSEFEMRSKDGQRLFMAFEGKVGNDKEGKFKQTHCILQDITEQKKAEQKLIESQAHYRAMIETTQDGFWVIDTKGQIIDVNETYCQMTGYKKNELKGMKIRDLEVLETTQDIEKHIKSIIENESDVFETRHKKKDGSLIDIEISATFVDFDAGIFAFCRDITKRKKNENELLYLSNHDHLTGLYNRRFLEDELKRLDTKQKLPLSVIMCDVNGLKLVNDSFGHDAGDSLLKKAAETIKKACRKEDVVARIGGDEFIILLPNTAAIESVQIANSIKELSIREKVSNIELSISYGYDTKTDEKQSMNETIANAENHMYRHKLYERSSLRSKTMDIIMNTLFEKSNREAAHSKRVSAICNTIATTMNLDKDVINQLGIAGLIHDIGKIGIDEKILNKPGKLTIDEKSEIERHPEIGWRILSSTNEFSQLAQFVLSHQEKWDGSGYPNGLKGEDIPLEARIIAVADAYDAMTSERSYRKALSKKEAINELRRCSGSQFDPSIVDVFVAQVAGTL